MDLAMVLAYQIAQFVLLAAFAVANRIGWRRLGGYLRHGHGDGLRLFNEYKVRRLPTMKASPA